MQTTEVRALFARRVRESRLARGMTQEQLAAALTDRGVLVEATAVVRLEQGRRKVGVEEAAALADILDVTLNDLLAPEIPPLRARLDDTKATIAALSRDAEKLANQAEKARLGAERFGHQARYLESLLAYQARGRLEDLVEALACGSYFGSDDHFHQDLVAAGVPEGLLADVETEAQRDFPFEERAADETALDVYIRVFVSKLTRAMTNKEAGTTDGQHQAQG